MDKENSPYDLLENDSLCYKQVDMHLVSYQSIYKDDLLLLKRPYVYSLHNKQQFDGGGGGYILLAYMQLLR